jgi:ribosome-associated toxin RatA of RatAB toxin-antitoxin module
MHTENSTLIHGPIDRIYALAANIENWPAILPHYRFVRLLDRSADGSRKVVIMSAVRVDFPMPGARFPVTWRSVQVCEPDVYRISFKHTRGMATGMWVVWSMAAAPSGDGVNVTISHELRYPIEIMNGWFASRLVGGFIHAIAGQTLATIKRIVEGRSELPPTPP